MKGTFGEGVVRISSSRVIRMCRACLALGSKKLKKDTVERISSSRMIRGCRAYLALG